MEGNKQLLSALGVLGVIGAAAAGYVSINTPEGAQCAVDLADASARLELYTEAANACKPALEACLTSLTVEPTE